jgi:metallo-beta-lactamase class B
MMRALVFALVTAAWSRPTEPLRIIDNVYYVGSEGLSSFLITSPAGHILVDGTLAENVAQIEANIKKLGFRLGDVKFLVNSHAHWDHAGGLAQLKRDTGAQLIASAGDKPLLERGGDKMPAVKVDRVIADGERVTVGTAALTAHLTPGHTPGCTSWSTRAGGAEVLFFCSATVAANRLTGTPTYPGIVDDYRRTFARARKFAVDVFLAPHPEMFHLAEKRARVREGAPNPFVDRGELARMLDELEKDFERELATQK